MSHIAIKKSVVLFISFHLLIPCAKVPTIPLQHNTTTLQSDTHISPSGHLKVPLFIRNLVLTHLLSIAS